jgi:hypothetical protein
LATGAFFGQVSEIWDFNMASVAKDLPSAEKRERLFFLFMAVSIVVTVGLAFGLFYQAELSSFDAPWWVHVHAVTFMGWIAIYLTQNVLVFRNDIAMHRRLGRIGAVYWMWMVLVGLILTPATLAAGRSPPFFTHPYFLALDWSNILVFGGLVYAALRNRSRTEWHRRLMLCATICVIAPAWGRLIVLSGNTMTASTNVATLLPYIAVGMVFDLVTRKRIHPAYLWGFGALVMMAAMIEIISSLPPFITLAYRIAG